MVPDEPEDKLVAVVADVAVVAVVANVEVAALPPILKFVTGVVEETTNGAVPGETVETICVPVIELLALTAVKLAEDRAVDPIATPSIVPPVIATADGSYISAVDHVGDNPVPAEVNTCPGMPYDDMLVTLPLPSPNTMLLIGKDPPVIVKHCANLASNAEAYNTCPGCHG
jgi:hypothetical protein